MWRYDLERLRHALSADIASCPRDGERARETKDRLAPGEHEDKAGVTQRLVDPANGALTRGTVHFWAVRCVPFTRLLAPGTWPSDDGIALGPGLTHSGISRLWPQETVWARRAARLNMPAQFSQGREDTIRGGKRPVFAVQG